MGINKINRGDKFRHLDLFSGIGGFALAAAWVWGEQHEIVSFCEIEQFPQKVLKKHWPNVPIHDDIKTLRGNSYGRIDLVSGGFPCQPYSCAGKQLGKEDDRALWPEMLRVIKEAKPCWVIGENVAGFVNMGLDDCLSDLENEGYETTAFIIPACSINAPHRRDRVWIIANSKQNRWGSSKQNISKNIRNMGDNIGIDSVLHGACIIFDRKAGKAKWTMDIKSSICRKDDGVPGRVDRIGSLGNAIVPQVVVPIMQAIKQITKGQKELF